MTLCRRTTKHAGEKGRERGGARRTTSRQTCLGSAEGGKIRINKIIMKIRKVEIWRKESRGDIKEKTEQEYNIENEEKLEIKRMRRKEETKRRNEKKK